MAWTPPTPVAPGVASSDKFNDEVIENLLYLFGRIQAGTFTISFGNSAKTSGTVVFPTPFAGAPIVVAVAQPITNNTAVNIGISGRSATQFSFRAENVGTHNPYTGNVTGYYIAFGPPA